MTKNYYNQPFGMEGGAEGEGCCGKVSILRMLLTREKLIVSEYYKISVSRKKHNHGGD